MYLPGKHALHFSQSLKFVNPCIINEKITVKGEVLDKSVATKIITIKTTIINESKKTIVDGTACVKIRDN
jgi:acyl dehydratase